MPLPPTTAPYQQGRPLAWVGAGIMGAVALIALLAGCSHGYSEKPPIGPTGPDVQTCRDRCDLQKTQCQQRQQTREQGCAAHYTSDMSDYDLCVKSGAPNCRAPYSCLGADLGICQQEYTPCVTACARPTERRLGPVAATPQPPATETPPTPEADKAPAVPPKVDKAPSPTPKVGKTGDTAGRTGP